MTTTWEGGEGEVTILANGLARCRPLATGATDVGGKSVEENNTGPVVNLGVEENTLKADGVLARRVGEPDEETTGNGEAVTRLVSAATAVRAKSGKFFTVDASIVWVSIWAGASRESLWESSSSIKISSGVYGAEVVVVVVLVVVVVVVLLRGNANFFVVIVGSVVLRSAAKSGYTNSS